MDPIDWARHEKLADPVQIVASLGYRSSIGEFPGDADRDEPIGLLTHHLVHDDVIWTLCERLIAHLAVREYVSCGPGGFRPGNKITFEI